MNFTEEQLAATAATQPKHPAMSREDFATLEALAQEIFVHSASDVRHAFAQGLAEDCFLKASAFLKEAATQRQIRKIW